MRWVKIVGISIACLALGLLGVAWFIKRPALVSAVDETNLPKFIQADFIDLSRITSISKFRSGSGHDFASHGETCRSMKHYFTPTFDPNGPQYGHDQKSFSAPDPATAIPIYSPVDGQIISISEERTPIGKQFSIRPTSQPTYTIRLFHVYPLDGVTALAHVKAGQQLGTIGANQGTDIAVQAGTLKGDQFVSYFQVMPDTLFAAYQARGATSRDDFVITRAFRDAHPLQCTGNNAEEFAVNYQSDPNYDGEFHLSGWVDSRQQYNQSNAMPQPNPSSSMTPGPSSQPYPTP